MEMFRVSQAALEGVRAEIHGRVEGLTGEDLATEHKVRHRLASECHAKRDCFGGGTQFSRPQSSIARRNP
jgi:hypothetical protein